MATKDRITCHILDTARGCPAAGVRVRLELAPKISTSSSTVTAASITSSDGTLPPLQHHIQPTQMFESQTNEDGRVTAWLPFAASIAADVPVYTLDDVLGKAEEEAATSSSSSSSSSPPTTAWTLRFDVEGYYGADEAFFPEVAVTFRVAAGQHYHVPLLLSPFSYTTYRGS